MIDKPSITPFFSRDASERAMESHGLPSTPFEKAVWLASVDRAIQDQKDYECVGYMNADNSDCKHVSYAELPKIPIRRRYFFADLAALGTQFKWTMVIFKRYLLQRIFRHRQDLEAQQEFQLVHLHTDLTVTIDDLNNITHRNQSFDTQNVPLILPVVEGTWELVVRRSNLIALKNSLLLDTETRKVLKSNPWLKEMDVLPKGITARAAQTCAKLPRSRMSRLYVDLLHAYQFHHVMKDIAESFAIQCPMNAVI
ncbi:MAG: hypothetical protein Q9170_000649 [Blastenia crenularia]